MHILRGLLIFFLFIGSFWQGVIAQIPEKLSAGEIQLTLKKLNVVGSALYLAAHPDDENQMVIGYLSQELLMNTGYLALTRGDGGQNLVGPEIRELLGVMRTEELIQARKVDGSHQFFTRAIDFGYSKTTDETLKLWNKDKILSDVVWVIRKFRPDVIITRFPPDDRAGHGHHSTSAVLAAEAFELAGDPNSYPEQLQYVKPWQPTRLMLNDTEWFTKDIAAESKKNDSILAVNVGEYNPLLGKSVNEIAAESRSKHQSQGFGSTGSRGQNMEYFRLVKGSMPRKSLFDGIDTTWNRVEGGKAFGQMIRKAYENFQPENPSAIVPVLMQISEALKDVKDDYWQRVKREELNHVIAACMGLYLETRTGTNVLGRRRGGEETVPGIAEYASAPGDTITLNVEVINRSGVTASLNKVTFTGIDRDTTVDLTLPDNVDSMFHLKAVIPQDIDYSGPYWLKKPNDGFTFTVDDQPLIGLDETQPVIEAHYAMTVDGKPIEFVNPVIYKSNNPRSGETYQPFVITPPVFVDIPEKVTVYASENAKPLIVQVKAGSANVRGKLSLDLPDGWQSDPKSYDYDLPMKGQDASFSFALTPPQGQSTGQVTAVATLDGKSYDQSLVVIDYPHIPTQTLFPKAEARLVKLNIKKQGNTIGYIMGAGDEVPEALKQIGYQVIMLQSTDLRPAYLEKMDAIMVGIRAYNTQEWLRYKNSALLQYVKDGGTLIVQYNTNHSLITKNFAPYPLELSGDRVTDETSAVKLLSGQSLLNTPNKITQDDFKGWVQERGLYFPNKWDSHYQPVLAMHDKGEKPLEGSLLIAPYGKGYYIYTGLSFFRELPAGVPGAFRLLTNMLSVGKHPKGKEKHKEIE